MSPLERSSVLSDKEVKALWLRNDTGTVQGVLRVGLDRRGRPEPIAFLPVEISLVHDVCRLSLPYRPMAFLLAGQSLEENSARSDVATHLIDHAPLAQIRKGLRSRRAYAAPRPT